MLKCENCGKDLNGKIVYEPTNDGEFYCQDCFEELFVTCSNCGEIIRMDDANEYDGEYYCQDCWDEDFIYCELCGEYAPRDSAFYDENHSAYCCESCFDYHYRRCECCNEWFHEDDLRYVNGEDAYVCDDCWYDNVSTCEECGDDLFTENGYWENDYFYCEGCHENAVPILSYHGYNGSYSLKKLSPDDDSLGAGIELEVEGSRETAKEVVKLDWLHCENDGSLNNGYEIISQPLTINNWKSWKAFKSLLDYLKAEGIRSHDTSTCGLHIHVDRKDINDINRVVAIVNLFKPEMEKLARRSNNHYCRYMQELLHDENPESVKKAIKDKKNSLDRYQVVNQCRWNTIEFRLFRGTLNYGTILATLELVDNIIKIANGTQTIIRMEDLIKGEYLPKYAMKRHVNLNAKINLDEFVNVLALRKGGKK